MSIEITLAKQTEQIDAIFKLRHQLLSKAVDNATSAQEKLPLNEGRILNYFDGFPTTSHFVVEDNKKVVGSLRFCLDSKSGVPADLVYDFREKLPHSPKIASCDMYCVNKNYHNPRVAQALIAMASYLAISHQVTHIIAAINPAIAKLMQKIGCKIIDKERPDPATGLDVVPVVLEISALKDFFIDFVKANQLDNFLGAYECVFYDEGDYIIKAGEKGDCVYVMAEGEVNVIHPRKYKMISKLKAGDVFGEIALLTDEGVRTANVVAITSVKVMRLDKASFEEYLWNNPKKAMAFMSRISKQAKQFNED